MARHEKTVTRTIRDVVTLNPGDGPVGIIKAVEQVAGGGRLDGVHARCDKVGAQQSIELTFTYETREKPL